jgi:hypothetical protein
MGVVREAADIAAHFAIFESETNREVVHSVRPKLNVEDGNPALRVRLPASPLPAIFAVVIVPLDEKPKFLIPRERAYRFLPADIVSKLESYGRVGRAALVMNY